MPTSKKPKSFESALTRLEEITEILEGGDTPLEKSISLYTEGLEIAQFCSKTLSEAEARIKTISEKEGVLVEEDFDEGNGET